MAFFVCIPRLRNNVLYFLKHKSHSSEEENHSNYHWYTWSPFSQCIYTLLKTLADNNFHLSWQIVQIENTFVDILYNVLAVKDFART